MKQYKLWAIMALAVLVAITIIVCNKDTKSDKVEELTKIRVATNKVPYSGLYIVAREKGFFEKQGLDVQTEIVGTGREGLDALMGGNLEMTFLAETPIANLAFAEKGVNIFATVGSGTIYSILARNDRSIIIPTDLKGKKIGTQKGTSMHFFTADFLESNSVSIEDVDLQNIGAKEMVPAFVRGDFDAISSFEPHTSVVLEQIAEKTTIFEINKPTTWNIAAKKEFVDKNPETIEKFLSAMIEAEDYVKKNKQESYAIISNFTGLEKNTLEKVFSTFNFKVSLDNTLVKLLNEQGNWAIQSGNAKRDLPDYRSLVNEKTLKKMDPARVNL